MRARTGSAGAGVFVFGFALAKELKILPFCLAGAALPEGFEDDWELVAEGGSDIGLSNLVASAFAGDASCCSGRLEGTIDSVEGFNALPAGAFADGAAGGGGGCAPVLRWKIDKH